MRYLILGGNGQLAREFTRQLQDNADILVADRNICDVTNYEELETTITNYMPNYVINCSAYNLVDLAESEGKDISYKINKEAPAHMAGICAEKNIFFIHFSTDYVFDGKKKNGLYVEEDPPSPLNHYGKSKLEGEQEIAKHLNKYLIFRTSWVYGNNTQNFIHKLKQWVQTNDQLNISCDEFSIPTSSKVIVDVTLKSITANLSGLYHLTCSDFCSRYDWVKEFLNITKQDIKLYPALRDDFNLAATRPFCSAMSNQKISTELNITIEDWRQSLKEFLLQNSTKQT